MPNKIGTCENCNEEEVELVHDGDCWQCAGQTADEPCDETDSL